MYLKLTIQERLKDLRSEQKLTLEQLAEKTGNIKACRAVGMANNKNPIPIIVPCHRVIGASGKLTGYAGGFG